MRANELFNRIKSNFKMLTYSRQRGDTFWVEYVDEFGKKLFGYVVEEGSTYFTLRSDRGRVWNWSKDECFHKFCALINRRFEYAGLFPEQPIYPKANSVPKPELPDNISPAAKYFPKQEEDSMSNENSAKSLTEKYDVCSALIDGYYVVDVRFVGGRDIYSYKVPEAHSVEVGDKLVVQAGTDKDSFRVVTVVAVKTKNDLEFRSGVKYKYAVMKLPKESFDNYEILVKSMQDFEQLYEQSVKQKGVDKLKEALLSVTSEQFQEGLNNV